MHAAVTHYNTVVLLDRKNIGRSRIKLTEPGALRGIDDTYPDGILRMDCTAHSVMLALNSSGIRFSVRPLTILTDTWCSSGARTRVLQLVAVAERPQMGVAP